MCSKKKTKAQISEEDNNQGSSKLIFYGYRKIFKVFTSIIIEKLLTYTGLSVVFQ